MNTASVESLPASAPETKNKKQRKREQWQAKLAERERLHALADSGLSGAIPVVSKTREQVHRAAMIASLSGQPFEDVKFFAFSRRTGNGEVDTPLPVLANSVLVRKASPHFDFVLAAGFSESSIVDLAAPYPASRPSSIQDYDYMSDSDLEDEDDIDRDAPQLEPVRPSDSSEKPAVKNESIEHVDDDKEQIVNVRASVEPNAPGTRPGRVVFLADIAHNTWKAFIFYAYFEEVRFASLRCANQPRATVKDPYQAPLCSPKSMYRVAEKYGIASLKTLATNNIKSQLSPDNVLGELFSTFTSLYPAIREVQLNYLHANMSNTSISSRLPTWIEAMEEGCLPKGAAAIISELIVKLNVPPAPAPVQPGMKACPNGCTSYQYRCNGCSRTF